MNKISYDKNGSIVVFTEDTLLIAADRRVYLPIIVISGVIILFGWILLSKRKSNLENSSKKRNISVLLQITAVLLLVFSLVVLFAYIRMNTDGTLPDWIPSSNNNNLIFSETWGSYRLDIWGTILNSFKTVSSNDIKLKLFGLGPDNLYILPGMTDLGSRVWGENSIVPYAHNELLNVYINMGLLGIIAYFGIFVTAAIYLISNKSLSTKENSERFKKENQTDNKKEEVYSVGTPGRVLALTCMIGYLAQNFFGYQWVCVTTVAFVLIGMGVAKYRD